MIQFLSLSGAISYRPRAFQLSSPLSRLALSVSLLIGWAIGLVSPTGTQASESFYKDQYVEVELYPLSQTVTAGEASLWALEFRIAPEWHIYWENPGDSGAPLILEWKWEGAQLLHFHYPPPKRIPVSSLVNFGYEEQVIFPLEVQVGPQAEGVQVNLDLEWLVCKVECIPGFAQLKAQAVVGPQAQAPHPQQALAQQFLAQSPGPQSLTAPLFHRQEDQLFFKLPLPQTDFNPQEVHLFPYDGLFFSHQFPEFLQLTQSQLDFSLQSKSQSLREPSDPRVLLVLRGTASDPVQVRSFDVELDFSPAQSPWTSAMTLLSLLALAFLGGLILNIMPCVLPVLSIKILSLSQSAHSPREMRWGGWFYSAGVLLSFALMGGLLLWLRHQGEEIGWGFQLQNPTFVSALILLFFVLGLNFLGVFEWGESLSRWAAQMGQRRSKLSGSFWTGVLAAFVASPCTAPFMGTALGASLMLSPWQSPLVFLSLGAGMAFPFWLLAHFPQFLTWLPKPGPWMKTLKEFFAFPLFLTAVWLLWVLGQQSSPLQTFILTGSLTLVAMGFWLGHNSTKPVFLWLSRLLILLFMALPLWSAQSQWALLAGASFQGGDSAGAESSSWLDYSSEKVADLVAQGEWVFIDFTAAWCITCQVNKINVLETRRLQELFDQSGVHRFRADWTQRDPLITQSLARYGRNSLPVYVFYGASGEPHLFSELLTVSMIEEVLQQQHSKEE